MEILNKLGRLVFALLLALAALTTVYTPKTSAATVTNTYIRETRMAAAATADIRVEFKATGGATGFTINFNGADTTTWTGTFGSLATSGITVSNVAFGNCDGATATPAGTPTATGASSTLTVTGVTALTSGQIYCWDITKAGALLTNPSAGEYHPVISETGGVTDSATVALRIVSNDQVSVTATVNPTFNFAISGCASNIDNLGTLSTTATTTTSGCTITINTNASNGWYAWAKDANTGLTSATTGKTITGSTAGSQTNLAGGNLGSNQYGLAITASSNGGSCASGVTCGTVSLIAAYDSTASGGANSLVGGLDTSLRTIASANGPSNAATLTVKMRANVNPTVPPASDYTDTITYVGAGYY